MRPATQNTSCFSHFLQFGWFRVEWFYHCNQTTGVYLAHMSETDSRFPHLPKISTQMLGIHKGSIQMDYTLHNWSLLFGWSLSLNSFIHPSHWIVKLIGLCYNHQLLSHLINLISWWNQLDEWGKKTLQRHSWLDKRQWITAWLPLPTKSTESSPELQIWLPQTTLSSSQNHCQVHSQLTSNHAHLTPVSPIIT